MTPSPLSPDVIDALLGLLGQATPPVTSPQFDEQIALAVKARDELRALQQESPDA